MGFVPNSLKIMARNPALLQGFMGLTVSLMGPSASLAPDLRQLIAHIASAAAGCRYCQAHTAHGAERAGVSAEKIAAVWTYETSPLFSESERAALTLAQAAGSVPNTAEGHHFDALKKHFSEDEIVEIVGIVALFGFLNRWNDTLATPLEESPLAFAEAQLGAAGWAAGKHI
ncbi:MAG: carboxymuconolactone decarboxylase family protein [Hyphomonas sp.]|nr:carboxymuconolactone decarboxylase family protein [Hyphomonas sp.]MBU4061852.1 carboxymuconolactone decarboxylase family protein [Alphaproteobacteria bacterium]MBU4163316.1 carboxymuconolactone decarboxylase family protein [Alphaproteobacteria bacterium]